MIQECDFSKAVIGNFFREGAELQLPICSDREFAQGQVVCLASDPSIRGAVVAVLPGTPEDRIKVFVDGSTQTYYASQLRADDQSDGVSSLSADPFHAYLTALQIRYPGLSTFSEAGGPIAGDRATNLHRAEDAAP